MLLLPHLAHSGWVYETQMKSDQISACDLDSGLHTVILKCDLSYLCKASVMCQWLLLCMDKTWIFNI